MGRVLASGTPFCEAHLNWVTQRRLMLRHELEELKSPELECSGAGGQNGQWCYAAESDGWIPLGTAGAEGAWS